MCPCPGHWILCSPYISLTCCISSSFFPSLPISSPLSPYLTKAARPFLERKDEMNLTWGGLLSLEYLNEINDADGTPFPWHIVVPRAMYSCHSEEWLPSHHLAVLPSSHPQHLLMNVYCPEEVRRQVHPHCSGAKIKEGTGIPSE